MNFVSVHSIAMTLSNTIAHESNFDNLKRAKLCYGLEVLIGAIIKYSIFAIAFWEFGLLKQSSIAMFTIAILRVISGGIHCKTLIKCIIVSTVVFISIGMLAKILVINEYLYFILNIVSLIIVGIKSPVDPPEKPIKTKQKRYVVKLLSILILLLIIYVSSRVTDNDVKNAILLAMYFQVLTLSGLDKISHKFIKQLKPKVKGVNLG